MAFNIPLILTGIGAGFLIGGPVGAAVGAAAGGFLGKKPDGVVVQTPVGPLVVPPAAIQNPAVPTAVQASADLVNRLVQAPVNLGPVTMPDGTPLGVAVRNPDGRVVTTTGEVLGPVYSPDGRLLGYLPATTASTTPWINDLMAIATR